MVRSFNQAKCYPDHIDFYFWSDLGYCSLHEAVLWWAFYHRFWNVFSFSFYFRKTLYVESILVASCNFIGDIRGCQFDLLVLFVWVFFLFVCESINSLTPSRQINIRFQGPSDGSLFTLLQFLLYAAWPDDCCIPNKDTSLHLPTFLPVVVHDILCVLSRVVGKTVSFLTFTKA